MSGDIPDPPIPAGVDLQGFAFTPIYRARLFNSAFNARASDSEWRAGVTLLLKTWDQMPPGSLPDDDIELCRIAELGRDMKTWSKVRVMALHGWYKASDGRLYNDTVAEFVLGALQKKRAQFDRTTAARQAAIERRRTSQAKPSVIVQEREQSQLQLQTDDRQKRDSVKESVTESKGIGVNGSEGKEIDPTGLVTGNAGDPPPGQTNVIGFESKEQAKQRRLSQITDEAIETYNLAPFTKKNGGEAKNADPVVGLDKRREQVKRVLKTASEICQTTYGAPTITREFWVDYWDSVNADPFKSGRQSYRNSEHPNWKPSFEYLTRVKTMLEVFDSAMSEDAA